MTGIGTSDFELSQLIGGTSARSHGCFSLQDDIGMAGVRRAPGTEPLSRIGKAP
jgi:hypothetical protein